MGVQAVAVHEQERRADATVLDAKVGSDDGATRHRVTLQDRDLARLAPRASATEFVTWLFTFLLAREPRESILASFDASVVSRYFPEFEAEAKRAFAR